jgi:hypothetical protein
MSVPTAEEFLQNYKNDSDHYADQDYSEGRLIKALQEFAKLHVEAALHIASERADLTDNGSFPYVDKLSILNSYPLDKIK